ncbi:hypothetical protein GGI20_005447 [Coemansia sp. BCRC 34301]|nr:hypothetical protein GGI20_005447 [Coemansia sp. BCRC 34301]
MHRTKPETARSSSTGGFQQSASLVSLPMLPRPSTGGGMMMLAPSGLGVGGGAVGNFKRPRVNSKAGVALGSLFRAKAQTQTQMQTQAHSKRDSMGSGLGLAGPSLLEGDAWGVGIDYPSVMSPLFSDESLQQLLGSSSPQLTAVAGPEQGLPLSPASRRSKREIAASVLQTSAGPFRRLRSGAHSKTMSYPPAAAAPATDEFVVVTPDMCPPAALVSSSVISGVSGSVRVRAQTQVIERLAYADSTESLVPVSAPSLSASSSEVSLARRRGHVIEKTSLEDQRRMSHVARLECLSPYTVSRLSNTAARASERRRRSSAGRRSRASSESWANATACHARDASDHSDFDAHSPAFWRDDDDDDDNDARVLGFPSGFPSSSSAHFDMSPGHARHHVTRSADEIRLARDVQSLLDPSSLLTGVADVVPLHVLARAEAALECVDELSDVPQSPCFSDAAEFDGSTLTQNSDWLLMNASSSDGEVPSMAVRPRRLRKRRVLPKTVLYSDERMYNASQSSDTLLAADADANRGAEQLPVVVAVVEPFSAPIVAPTALSVARLPLSISLHMPCLGRLSLHCAGDSWAPARIPFFALQLNNCIERMPGLADLLLVNLGLTAVPPRLLACRGLRRLDLSHNWITTVPAFLSRLSHLRHIQMPDNPVRQVATDLVEMRHRLDFLNLGYQPWTLLPRRPAAAKPPTPEARADMLHARTHRVAQRRMAQCLAAPRLSLTQRQHEAQLARATQLLSIYSNALYSSLREPRSWGHSVALPRPTADLHQCF